MHSYWIVFLSAALLLNLAPGPDMLFLVTQTLSRGKRIGLASMLGFGTGALMHATFVALGVSALLATSAMIFKMVKWAGAAYLFYLGISSIVSGRLDVSLDEPKQGGGSFVKTYLQAVAVDLTNPKVALFFVAFLPQFYRDDGGSKLGQFLLLGLIIVIIGFLVEGLIIVLSDRIARLLKADPRIASVIDKAFGAVLVALGLRLVLEKNS